MFRHLLGYIQALWENRSKSYLYLNALWDSKCLQIELYVVRYVSLYILEFVWRFQNSKIKHYLRLWYI